MVPATQAIALPPPGGPAVISVIERRYANAIQQNIVLATEAAAPGENFLRVQMFGPVGREAGDTRLTDRPIALAGISSEMRQSFPGIAMQRSALYAQNSFGPFGYAFGRHGSRDLCLYAWQRIAGSTQGAPFANMGAIQTRLRLCQAGATEQSLLAVMYGYTLNSAFSSEAWNPLGKPPPADPRLGQTGQPIYPSSMSLQAPPAEQTAPAPRRRSPPALPVPPANTQREEVIVPPPPGSDR